VRRFDVGKRLVRLGHARLGELVQCPAQGRSDEGGAPTRSGGCHEFQLPCQRLVQFYYQLFHYTCSINSIYEKHYSLTRR
jgi:hypothetical protein